MKVLGPGHRLLVGLRIPVSNIYYGPRQQILQDIKALGSYDLVRDLRDMYTVWHTPLSPAKHLVFITDIPLDMTDFIPRADRHLGLLDQLEMPALVKKWADKNKPKIRLLKALNPSRHQLLQVMVNGKIGIQFTSDAANLLLDLRPGGLQSLYWPIEQLKDLGVSQPVTPESLMGQWPVKHETDAFIMFRALGSVEAIRLADNTSEDKAWGGLHILTAMCKSKPIYLDYLELCKTNIINKQLRPKAALSTFTRLCYLHHKDKLTIDLLEG